jgi:hypothetical protein
MKIWGFDKLPLVFPGWGVLSLKPVTNSLLAGLE